MDLGWFAFGFVIGSVVSWGVLVWAARDFRTQSHMSERWRREVERELGKK